jgi:hypothetical protein
VGWPWVKVPQEAKLRDGVGVGEKNEEIYIYIYLSIYIEREYESLLFMIWQSLFFYLCYSLRFFFFSTGV